MYYCNPCSGLSLLYCHVRSRLAVVILNIMNVGHRGLPVLSELRGRTLYESPLNTKRFLNFLYLKKLSVKRVFCPTIIFEGEAYQSSAVGLFSCFGTTSWNIAKIITYMVKSDFFVSET